MLELIPPVWVVVAMLGLIVASFHAVLAPPHLFRFPAQILTGVVGAGLGQIGAESAGIDDQFIGDAHVASIVVTALLLVVVVRRLAP